MRRANENRQSINFLFNSIAALCAVGDGNTSQVNWTRFVFVLRVNDLYSDDLFDPETNRKSGNLFDFGVIAGRCWALMFSHVSSSTALVDSILTSLTLHASTDRKLPAPARGNSRV